MAMFVAINILWSGWKLMKVSVLGLMDTAPDDETINAIRNVIAKEGDGALEAHDLRARLSGSVTFIEFHLVVDGNLSVNEAHQICDRIEARLARELPNSRINIHVEPEFKAETARCLYKSRLCFSKICTSKFGCRTFFPL